MRIVSAQRKVAYIDHTVVMSGGEVYLLNLLTYLDKDKFLPVMILPCWGPLAEKLQDLGIKVEVIAIDRRVTGLGRHKRSREIMAGGTAVFNLAASISRIARFLRAEGVSLVHTNSLKANLYGGLAGKLAGRPVVWHLHDILGEGFFPRAFCRSFAIFGSLFADAILCNSLATRKAFIGYGGRPEKALTIWNGIDVNRFDPCRHPSGSLREELGLPAHVPLIGHLGRLAPWKGQRYFVEAAARIRERIPEAHFLIVGEALFGDVDRAYREELEALIGKLGLSHCLKLVGFRDDIPSVIAALDLVVHSSVEPEGFGLVLAEAMAMRKPIVAVKVGGVPEVIQDGVTGLLVPPRDPSAIARAALTLLKDGEGAMRMGQAGRERALSLFTMEQNARAVERAYEGLLEGRRRG